MTQCAQTQLNHGLSISSDGETIYASNSESVFSWPYSNITGLVTANATTLVSGMKLDDGDSGTRTVLVSQVVPGMIVVSKGSNGSLDEARNMSSGFGQVKAFNLTALSSASKPYDFSSSGTLLGWGLYNAVGLAEHPKTGGIFSMDNGQDNLKRSVSTLTLHDSDVMGFMCGTSYVRTNTNCQETGWTSTKPTLAMR